MVRSFSSKKWTMSEYFLDRITVFDNILSQKYIYYHNIVITVVQKNINIHIFWTKFGQFWDNF